MNDAVLSSSVRSRARTLFVFWILTSTPSRTWAQGTAGMGAAGDGLGRPGEDLVPARAGDEPQGLLDRGGMRVDRPREGLSLRDGGIEGREVAGDERREGTAAELAESLDLLRQARQLEERAVERGSGDRIALGGQLRPRRRSRLVGHRRNEARATDRHDRNDGQPDDGEDRSSEEPGHRRHRSIGS